MIREKDYLAHHGVKGMKWGIRKKYDKKGNKSQKALVLEGRTKSGKKIKATQSEANKLIKFFGKYNINVQKQIDATKNMDLCDESGNKIGGMQLFHESPNSVNVTWIDINPKYRGNGYATTAMHMAEKYARESGAKQMTLEVPGNSPDARHIYEKMGFKDVEVLSADDDIWGGLTSMRKKL